MLWGFSVDAVVVGFGLSSWNGSWLTDVVLFLGPMLLHWATSGVAMSALLPPRI